MQNGRWILLSALLLCACGDDDSCESTRTCSGETRSDGGPDASGGRSDSGGGSNSGGTSGSGGASSDSGGTAGSGGESTGSGGTLIDGSAGGSPEAGAPLGISVTDLPSPTLKKPYTFAVETSGGSGDVTFRVERGALPAGLRLTASGTIEGTPTAWGDFNVTIEAKSGEETVSRAFALRVVSRLWLAFDSDSKKFVVNVGAGTPYAPTDVGGAGAQEAWSPDGKHLSFVTSQNSAPTVNLVDLSGTDAGTPRAAWSGPAGCFPVAVWAPDSSKLAVSCGQNVVLVDPKDGGLRSISQTERVDSIVWSPDARWIITTAATGRDAAFVDVTNGTTKAFGAGLVASKYFWPPNSEWAIAYGKRVGDPADTYSSYFATKPQGSSLLAPTILFDGLLSVDSALPPLFTRDGKTAISLGGYDGGSTFRSFIKTDLSGTLNTLRLAARIPTGEPYMAPTDIFSMLVNRDAILLYSCLRFGLNGENLLCGVIVQSNERVGGWELSGKRMAANPAGDHLLLPELVPVNPNDSQGDKRGALIHYTISAANGFKAVETFNEPALQSRQPEFGFAPDTKGAYFLESVSGAPAKTYYVDLRGVVHRTVLLDTGGPSFLGSTAFSPSVTHLTTISGSGASGAQLKLYDVRGTTPSAALTLSGSGRVTRASWQPTWD